MVAAFVYAQETKPQQENFIFNKSKMHLHGFFGKEHLSNLKQKLGLPENATSEQIKEAIKNKWATEQEKNFEIAREKLGLNENASIEDVQSALYKWAQENKELVNAIHHKLGHFRGTNKIQ